MSEQETSLVYDTIGVFGFEPDRLARNVKVGRRIIDLCAEIDGFIFALELKTSREDFLSELRNPEKSRCFRMLSDSFWFALRPGVFVEGDQHRVFTGCGVIEIFHDGEYTIHQRPDRLSPSTNRSILLDALEYKKSKDFKPWHSPLIFSEGHGYWPGAIAS